VFGAMSISRGSYVLTRKRRLFPRSRLAHGSYDGNFCRYLTQQLLVICFHAERCKFGREGINQLFPRTSLNHFANEAEITGGAVLDAMIRQNVTPGILANKGAEILVRKKF